MERWPGVDVTGDVLQKAPTYTRARRGRGPRVRISLFPPIYLMRSKMRRYHSGKCAFWYDPNHPALKSFSRFELRLAGALGMILGIVIGAFFAITIFWSP